MSLKRNKDRITCTFCGKTKIKIGEKYGILTVLSKDNNYKNKNKISSRKSFFSCKCECGNIVIKDSSYLLTSKEPNCGCKNKEKIISQNKKRIKNITNEKFGLLTVKNINEELSKKGNIFWNTTCACGNTYVVSGKHLKRGATLSCGCLKTSFGEKIIEEILKQNKINFKKEFLIKELKNKRFDFAIFSNGSLIRLIEYDGEQHFYKSTLFGEKEFNRLQESDLEKDDWARKNNIPLVRIPYKYKNKITYDMLFNNENFLVK